MKKNSILRGLLILMFLLITSNSLAKVNISGSANINIWFDTTSNNKKSKVRKYVGNIDDKEFLEKPFIINGKGYALLNDQYNNKYLLRVIFDRRGNVIHEDLFETQKFTVNCLGIKGDDSFCITIKSNGIPAIWDRYESTYIFSGRFVDSYINNPFKSRNYYDDQNYFDSLFEF